MNGPFVARAGALALPVLAIMLIVALVPLAMLVGDALWDAAGGGAPRFVGFRLFIEELGDPALRQALWRQLRFSGLALLVEVPLGLAVGLAIPARGAWAGLCLALLALPLATPAVAIGAMWAGMVVPEFGLVSAVAGELGVAFEPTARASDAWAAAIAMEVWHWTPLVALVVHAGRRAVPETALQAARIDAASRWKTFRYVELPKLRGVLWFVVLLRLAQSLVVFAEPDLLTGRRPDGATTFLSSRIVTMVDAGTDPGAVAAVSLVYLTAMALLAWAVFRSLRKVGAGIGR